LATHSVLSRIEALAAVLAARQRECDEDVVARLTARLEAALRKRQEYEALPVAAKIAAKQQALAELAVGSDLYAYRYRSLELDVMELQGASANVLQIAREQSCEAMRFRRPMPAIPTEIEATEILEAARAHVACPAPDPAPRKKPDNVIVLANRRELPEWV
jgi:hypothetical protein